MGSNPAFPAFILIYSTTCLLSSGPAGGMAPSLVLPCMVHPQAKILSEHSLLNPSPAFESWREASAIHRRCRPDPHLPSLPGSWGFAVRGICLPSPAPAARGQGSRGCGDSVVARGMAVATEAPFGFQRQRRVPVMVSTRQARITALWPQQELRGALFKAIYPPRLVLQASQRCTEIFKILECIAFLFKCLELGYVACKRISNQCVSTAPGL